MQLTNKSNTVAKSALIISIGVRLGNLLHNLLTILNSISLLVLFSEGVASSFTTPSSISFLLLYYKFYYASRQFQK